jgi:hypothetical protein
VTTTALVLRERWAVEDPVLDCAILICDMAYYRSFTAPEDDGSAISPEFRMPENPGRPQGKEGL